MTTPSRREFLKETAASVLAAVSSRLRATAAHPATPSALTDESPVSAVRYLGKQFLNNPVGVTGADGATSIALPSGESLWVFGDTVEGPFETIRGLDLTPFNSNTAALVPRKTFHQALRSFISSPRPMVSGRDRLCLSRPMRTGPCIACGRFTACVSTIRCTFITTESHF